MRKTYLRSILALVMSFIFVFSSIVVMAAGLNVDDSYTMPEQLQIYEPDVYYHEDGGITILTGDFAGVTFTAEELLQLRQNENELIAMGESLLYARVTFNLPIQRLRQYGESWSDDRMYNSSGGFTGRIGAIGCTLTSFTMVARLYGEHRNPGQMNAAIGRGAAPFVWNTAIDATPHIRGFHIPLQHTTRPPQAQFRATARGAIASGFPVIIGIGAAGSSSSGHWIVAHGFSGDEIFVTSPGRASLTTLSQVFNGGETVISYAILAGNSQPVRPPCFWPAACGCPSCIILFRENEE